MDNILSDFKVVEFQISAIVMCSLLVVRENMD